MSDALITAVCFACFLFGGTCGVAVGLKAALRTMTPRDRRGRFAKRERL